MFPLQVLDAMRVGGVAMAIAALLPFSAQAQITITGSFGGTTSPPVDIVQVSFSCSGTSPCTGNYTLVQKTAECSNTHSVSDLFSATGLNVAAPGPIAGTFTMKNGEFTDTINGDGTCSITNSTDIVLGYTGTWDGSGGTFTINLVDQGVPFAFTGSYSVTSAPVFPMVVTGSIGPVVSNIRADIQFRSQDLGTTQSIYAFAVAPQNLVTPTPLADPMPPLAKAERTDGAKEGAPVACVLAQLNAAGRLQQVSASSMQAFVTGVLGAQGASVAVLNGTATVNIGGATFYVGYGASAQSMLSGGINRNVVAVPGTSQCRPAPPKTGWWWYAPETGRGYSLEAAGRNFFYAAFLYDEQGRSKWYVATGPMSIDGSLFTGNLLEVLGGQTLFDAYRAPSTLRSVGPITLAFNSATSGTQVWPGGTIPIERFNIVPNGLTAPPQANVPESGWWWNPDESGRGFFIEFQNGSVDIAGYMYDDAGNAVWYLTVLQTPNPRQWAGSWWTFGGGQTLTGAYRPNTQTSNNFAPLAIQFDSATTTTLTLPGGRTTRLVRHRF